MLGNEKCTHTSNNNTYGNGVNGNDMWKLMYVQHSVLNFRRIMLHKFNFSKF